MRSEKANLPLIQLKDIEIIERNIGKGSYGICDVGFYGTTCVAVKRIQQWSEFKTEEAVILSNVSRLSLARGSRACGVTISFHRGKICYVH